jgi:hypothetical protein
MDLINDPERKILKVSRRSEAGFLIPTHESDDSGSHGLDTRIRPRRSLVAYIVKLWVLIFGVYYFGESFWWSGRTKDPSLVQFSNVVARNDSYTFKVVVHDLLDKVAEDGLSADQLVYADGQLSSNFTVLSRRLLRRYDRFRVEVVASFNSTITNKTENSSCFIELAYQDLNNAPVANATEASTDPDGNPVRKEWGTVRTRLLVQMIYDDNNYDFTEDPLLGYVYARKKRQADQANATSRHYRPKLECSQFWAQDSDTKSLDILPEDDSVPIFVDLQTISIERYLWALKFRLVEKTLEDWNVDQKWARSLKSVIAGNSSDLMTLFVFVCVCKLAISLFVIPLAKYTTITDMAETIWSAKRCVLRVIGLATIVTYLVQTQASLVLITVIAFQLAEATLLTIKKLFLSGKTSPHIKERNLFDYLMFPVIALSFSHFISAHTGLSSVTSPPSILQPLAWIAYGFEAVSLAAPISANQVRKSTRVFAKVCPFYEFFTAIVDDLSVLLVNGPMPQVLFAFANDLVFGLYMIQALFLKRGGRSAAGIDGGDTKINIRDIMKQKHH